jgi:transcriptional regulator with XRE-family HTH domain
MDIGKRLRELRLARGVSVADLEARTGIPQDGIAAVEEGTLSAPVTRGDYNQVCEDQQAK